MKNEIISFCVAGLCILQCTTMQAQRNIALPVGIWQLAVPSEYNTEKTNFAPVWKIYCPDGTFTVMAWKSTEQSAYITTTGNYTTEGDTIINESVTYSSHDTINTGMRNRIATEYIDNNCMVAHHYVASTGNKWEELWKRLTLGEPNTTDITTDDAKKSAKASADVTGVYYYTEEMPTFVGGSNHAMQEYIQSHITYPAEALAKGMDGMIIARFVVNEKGIPENLKVIRSSHKILDTEAVRVLKTLRFIPGKHNGKNVKVYLTVPVEFKIR